MTGSALLKSVAAGFAGACALTLLHELIRRTVPRAPRLDVLGMRAIARSMRAMDAEPPQHLHETALIGDLVANTAYYSLVAAAGENSLMAGSLLGTAAGVGSVLLPAQLSLGKGPSDRTPATQAMTVALYLAGGLVAGSAYKQMH